MDEGPDVFEGKRQLGTFGWAALNADSELVAFVGGDLIQESDDDGSEHGIRRLGFLYGVSDNHRGNRYGRAAIEAVIEQCTYVDAFSCTVSAENSWSLDVLEGIGMFTRVDGKTGGTMYFNYQREAATVDEAQKAPGRSTA